MPTQAAVRAIAPLPPPSQPTQGFTPMTFESKMSFFSLSNGSFGVSYYVVVRVACAGKKHSVYK